VRASIVGGIIAGTVGALLYINRDQTVGVMMDIQFKEQQ
jgi:hypothetical protein